MIQDLECTAFRAIYRVGGGVSLRFLLSGASHNFYSTHKGTKTINISNYVGHRGEKVRAVETIFTMQLS